jgi:hypothetical protein
MIEPQLLFLAVGIRLLIITRMGSPESDPIP